jgi:hypothetical protein
VSVSAVAGNKETVTSGVASFGPCPTTIIFADDDVSFVTVVVVSSSVDGPIVLVAIGVLGFSSLVVDGAVLGVPPSMVR